MATQAYWDWVNAGRKWRAAKPITEMRAKIQAAVPGATIYVLGAEQSHLQVPFPQDHAPFSFTPWDGPLPGYVVCAVDYMHDPDGGLDCETLFQRWLADCKAGRRPWTKYLIWKAKLYDVRNDWEPQANSDHFDHIHESTRSDYADASIGDYHPLGDEDDMYTDEDRKLAEGQYWMLKHLLENIRTHDAAGKHTPVKSARGLVYASGNGVKQQLDSDSAMLAASAVRETQTQAALAALADAVNRGGGNVDAARIIAHMDQVAAGERQHIEALQDQLGAMQRENAELRQRLSDAYKPAAVGPLDAVDQ